MSNTIGDRLQSAARERKSKERFIKTRMWISTLSSLFFPDKRNIPENIGNNIFIGNNQIVTKNSITTAIVIQEFSLDTLIAFTSDMILKTKLAIRGGVLVDTVFLNKRRNLDINGGGMQSRLRQWERTLGNPLSSKKSKKRAARLIYTYEKAAGIDCDKEKLFYSKAYIIIRAKTGSTSEQATQFISEYLTRYNILHKVIKSDMNSHAEKFSLMQRTSNRKNSDMNIMSARTLAESLPDTQGYNDLVGNFLGVMYPSRAPYFINCRNSAKGKNIFVVGPNGEGKTFLAENWLIDAYTIGYNLAIMDMKGGEFSVLIDAIQGMTLSMSSDSTQFINTYKWEVESVVEDEYAIYAKERKNMTIEQLCILAKPSEEQETRTRQLMETFLNSLYLLIGVSEDNPNTWYRTLGLHPYNVFKKFKNFSSVEIKEHYADIIEDVMDNLSITMDIKGNYSHIFRNEFNYSEIMKSKSIVYEFAALSGNIVRDKSIFKLKLLFMETINNDYARYKKKKGEWVFKLLEESQFASDYIMDIYIKELTLRRSQNQVTVMLTNSLQALHANPKAKAAMDNINILVAGGLPKTPRDMIIQEFGLQQHEKTLKDLYENEMMEHTFFISNKMTGKSLNSLIKAEVPQRVVDGPLFKIIDKEDGEEIL